MEDGEESIKDKSGNPTHCMEFSCARPKPTSEISEHTRDHERDMHGSQKRERERAIMSVYLMLSNA